MAIVLLDAGYHSKQMTREEGEGTGGESKKGTRSCWGSAPQDGAVYYEDAGSSNGSWIDSGEGEEEVFQGDLHPLETGFVLHVGQTLFAVTVEANY